MQWSQAFRPKWLTKMFTGNINYKIKDMELEKFVRNFAEQFDDIDVSEIQGDTVFQDLDEWTSLAALTIIAMINSEYGITVSGKEIRSCETIKDLYSLVFSK